MPRKPRTLSMPWAIFWLLSGFYLLTLSGHTYSPDEETMLAVTRSLLARGEVAVVAEEVGSVAALRPGRDGGRYAPYGLLPSLLALPLHGLGAMLGGSEAAARDYASRFAVTALNGPLTAATAALLAAWALRLGATHEWALLLGLSYGLATFAWPYARTFFSEPLAALLILVAAERTHAAVTSLHPRRDLLLVGGAVGLLLTTRLAAGVVLPVLGVAALVASWCVAQRQQSSGCGPLAEPAKANGPLAEPAKANGPLAEPVEANGPLAEPAKANGPLAEPAKANGPLAEPVEAPPRPFASPRLFRANKDPTPAAINQQRLEPPPATEGMVPARPTAVNYRYLVFLLLIWSLAMLPGLALLGWYNYARFGTLLASGYASEAGLFTTALHEGLYGMLFSPGKSIFLYAPPLLLALPGSYILWRRDQRGVVLLGWGLFLSHLLLYARWSVWEGGGVWGPRFLLPVVAPLLLLGIGVGAGRGEDVRTRGRQDAGTRGREEARTRGRESAGTRTHEDARTRGCGDTKPTSHLAAPPPHRLIASPPLRLIASLLLLLLGFSANLGGVLLNFSTYGVTPITADRVDTLQGSALVGHWRILGARWAAYRAPPPTCRLGAGWFPSEAADGATLPRRSGAQGVIHCTAPGTRLHFSLDDRRPPDAAQSALQLTLNGQPLATPPAGQLRSYQLLLPPTAARLELNATPWNPREIGFSDRDDQLGPQLAFLRGTSAEGTALALADTAVAPLPVRPNPRWAWYYDPPNQHVADHWAWYLPQSELQGPRAWLLAGLLLLLGGGAFGAGVRQILHLVPLSTVYPQHVEKATQGN